MFHLDAEQMQRKAESYTMKELGVMMNGLVI